MSCAGHKVPLLGIGLLLSLGSGCVLIPPVGKVVHGTRPAQTILDTLLVEGRTKREIVAELGMPLLEARERRAIAYRWETETTYGVYNRSGR